MKTDTKFSIEADLSIGENEIIIEARDHENSKNRFTLIALRKADEVKPDLSLQSQVLSLHKYLELRQGGVYAVIIGIGDYLDANIPDLRFTVNDAQGMYDVLVDQNYGRVAPDNIKLLLNEEATVTNIKAAIGTWLNQKAKAEDTVLIYYAGHGAEEAEEKDYTYWLTYEANSQDYYSSALSNTAIVDMLDRIKSKRQVIFLDSCHSAATVIARNQPNAKKLTRNIPSRPILNPAKQFAGEGRAIISASKGEQLSVELKKYRHGVFTYFLLEGLKGKAEQNGDAVVDVNEIWNYVNAQVPAAADRYGANPQTPVLESQKLTSGILLTFDLPSFRKKLQDQKYQARSAEIITLFHAQELSTEEYRKIMYLLKTDTADHILQEYFNKKLSLEELKEILQHMPGP